MPVTANPGRGRAARVGISLAALTVLATGARGQAGPPTVATIPVCPGLSIVTAIAETGGDYESIKTIEAAGPTGVRLRYSSERTTFDIFEGKEKFGRTDVVRSVRAEDLAKATSYLQQFGQRLPETVPGTTAIGTSAAVLDDLKRAGKADFAVFIPFPPTDDYPADRNVHPNVYDHQMTSTISRVEAKPVLLPVLINGAPSLVPTIHAAGEFYGDKAEFFFLDDPANPLTIKFRIGIGAILPIDSFTARMKGTKPTTEPTDKEVLEVIKIDHRCAAPAATAGAESAGSLEQALANGDKVDVYDIHFSFDSDQLRKESEPRLAEIAAVLGQHPDWTLSVTGHTDNVARDAYNLDLSRRRAAAVKSALVSRYHIAPERLRTTGVGESQPRDTNDTLEGRARNRRVELRRI